MFYGGRMEWIDPDKTEAERQAMWDAHTEEMKSLQRWDRWLTIAAIILTPLWVLLVVFIFSRVGQP